MDFDGYLRSEYEEGTGVLLYAVAACALVILGAVSVLVRLVW